MPVDAESDEAAKDAPASARPEHERRYGSLVGGHLIHGLPVLILLVAAALSAHTFHHAFHIPSFDDAFARAVVPLRPPHRDDDAVRDRPVVQVLEYATRVRIDSLEETAPLDGETVERTAGIRPLSRTKMAALLSDIADRLDAPGTRKPRVIAIDVDLAPLERTNRACTEEGDVIRALDRLRRHSDVVVIALDRPDSHRAARNEFMVNAGCTTPYLAPPRAAWTGACTDKTTREAKPADPKPRGLYFASPRWFTQQRAAPLKFLTVNNQISWSSPAQLVDQIPKVYPSTGTLAHLLLAGSQPVADVQDGAAPAVQARATVLCDQAHDDVFRRKSRLIFEDLFSEESGVPVDPAEVASRFDLKGLNWRLLDSTEIERTVVADLPSMAAPPADAASSVAAPQSSPTRVDDDRLDADVLIVAVDGGPNNDKFSVPTNPKERVSGAMLQGLQVLSLQHPLREGSWEGAVFDLLVGLAFLLPAALLVAVLEILGRRAPSLANGLLTVLPIALAAMLTMISLRVAAAKLNDDIWLNPAYVIAGLVLHAYLERAHGHLPEVSWRAVGRAFSFGWSAVATAYGAPRHRHESHGQAVFRIADAMLGASAQTLILGLGVVSLGLALRPH